MLLCYTLIAIKILYQQKYEWYISWKSLRPMVWYNYYKDAEV